MLAYLGIHLSDSKYRISVNGHKYVSITVIEIHVLFSLASVKVLASCSTYTIEMVHVIELLLQLRRLEESLARQENFHLYFSD